jgi:hypothetical protein
MVRAFARGAELAPAMRQRMLRLRLALLRHHPRHLRLCMQRLQCRPRRLQQLRVRQE